MIAEEPDDFFLIAIWKFQSACDSFSPSGSSLDWLTSYLAEPMSLRGNIFMFWIKLSASKGKITGVSISLRGQWSFTKINNWILPLNRENRRWFLSTRLSGCYGNVNSTHSVGLDFRRQGALLSRVWRHARLAATLREFASVSVFKDDIPPFVPLNWKKLIKESSGLKSEFQFIFHLEFWD